MDTLYQSLVTVNPVTLIAQICNLFLQLLVFKIFFLERSRQFSISAGKPPTSRSPRRRTPRRRP